MSRKPEHCRAGLIAGGTAGLIRGQDQPKLVLLLETLGGAWGGWIGGQIPDWLEPAKGNPRHRGLCHSEIAVMGVLQLGKKAVRGWEGFFRDTAGRLEEEARQHPDQVLHSVFRLLIAGSCRIFAGFLAGLVAGFVSHILLDAATSTSIGILGMMKPHFAVG